MRLNFLLLLYLTNKKKVAWQCLRKGNAIVVLSHNICLQQCDVLMCSLYKYTGKLGKFCTQYHTGSSANTHTSLDHKAISFLRRRKALIAHPVQTSRTTNAVKICS
jgi:hypothetical protein